MPSDPITPAESKNTDASWLDLVKAQVEHLRYGVVQLVVHEGRVTQIETTEKVRLPHSRESRPAS
jgi:hypothetical protein